MSQEEAEQRVRERAYALWEQAGRPEGQADEFWDRAHHEIQGEPDGLEPSEIPPDP